MHGHDQHLPYHSKRPKPPVSSQQAHGGRTCSPGVSQITHRPEVLSADPDGTDRRGRDNKAARHELWAGCAGHPLYTYAGDTAPGQDKGNGLNVSGGLWYNVPVSGNAAPAATSSAKSSGSGYGY